MNEQIQDELHKVLSQWQHGTPVRTLAIGHRTRPRKNEHGDTVHVPIPFRQAPALELVFELIADGLERSEDFEFPEFRKLAHDLADKLHLTADEFEAAASFAWVVMHRGWARSLEGHHERDLITVKKQADT